MREVVGVHINWTRNMNNPSHLGRNINIECMQCSMETVTQITAATEIFNGNVKSCWIMPAHTSANTDIQHSLNKGLCYKLTHTHKTHLDVAPICVVAVELAHVVSVARVFHFSVDENVPGEQSHFSTHVDPIYDLSNVVVLRPPWAEQMGRESWWPFQKKNLLHYWAKPGKGASHYSMITNVKSLHSISSK